VPAPVVSPLSCSEPILTPVAISLGSNIGDRRKQLIFGVEELNHVVEDLVLSPLYETDPLHITDQRSFLNACCIGRTRLTPIQLLSELQDIERRAGRRAGRTRYGPRELDLDLLLYGRARIRRSNLEIPHPRIAERAFVLVPLAELAPDWPVPGAGGTEETVASLLSQIEPHGVDPVE
jgi:2-amino-4-hydroxy-6-hydroxymethyldihydropteridine diphosphokinase